MTKQDKGERYWDTHAKDYDRSMLLLGRPVPRMAELAADAVRGMARVLEVGAGTGLVTLELARAAQLVVATDYSSAMVDMLSRRMSAASIGNVECEQADIYTLRFDPGAFDAVVAANVFHLVPDFPEALRALRRILRPGGLLIGPTYCHDETRLSWLVSRILAVSGFPGHRRFTADRLRDCLESEGFRITRAEVVPGVIPIGYVEGVFDT